MRTAPAFACAAFLMLTITASGSPATSTEHEKPVNQQLLLEERRLNNFYDLEYAMRELMWHQSMSILAAYGNYNSYEAPGKKPNANDLMRLKNRVGWNKQSIANFNRQLRRDISLPREDADRAEDISLMYKEFISAAIEVVEFLESGDARAANLAYRDKSVPLSKDIGAQLYSLRRASRDRFAEVGEAIH